jgi:hypothetical protein
LIDTRVPGGRIVVVGLTPLGDVLVQGRGHAAIGKAAHILGPHLEDIGRDAAREADGELLVEVGPGDVLRVDLHPGVRGFEAGHEFAVDQVSRVLVEVGDP